MIDDSTWVYALDDPVLAWREDLPQFIGAKAAGLVRLFQAGFNVPLSAVIPIEVGRGLLTDGKLPKGLRGQIQTTVQRFEERSGRRFGDSDAPLPLAVRSGGAVSMPGALLTMLNVAGWEELHRAVSSVMESWSGPAAQAFRDARNLDHDGGTAVLIQEMIETDVAGVLFTRLPETDDRAHLVIEAVSGSGDELVSGRVAARRWRVDRASLQRTHEDQVEDASRAGVDLDDVILRRIGELGLQIEELFGEAVDVEWGLRGSELFVFQARPIRHAAPSVRVAAKEADWPAIEATRLRAFAADGDDLWVRHNLAESAPLPTPLTWSLLQRLMSVDGGMGMLYRQLGFLPSTHVDRSAAELIAGRIYASPRRLSALQGADLPFAFDRDEILADPSRIDAAPTRLDLEHVSPWFLLRLPLILSRAWKVRRRLRRLVHTVEQDYRSRVLLEYEAFLTDMKVDAVDETSVAAIFDRYQQLRHRVLDEFFPRLMLPGTVGAALLATLAADLTSIVGRDESRFLLGELLQSLEYPIVARQQTRLRQVAAGDVHVDRFLEEFGHRCGTELELSEPRLRETPDLVATLAANAAGVRAGGDDARRTQSASESFAETFRVKLERAGGVSLHPRLEALVRNVRRLLPYREEGKHELARGYDLIRQTLEALAHRTGWHQNIYFLRHEEITGVLTTGDLTNVPLDSVPVRRRERETARRWSPPAVIEENDWNGIAVTDLAPATGTYRGTSISSGVSDGPAWHLHDGTPTNPDGLVLVCEMLLPELLPILPHLRGIVVDQANLLSHGAVLAREFSIPTVVLTNATRMLPRHCRLLVDGDTGWVTVRGTAP